MSKNTHTVSKSTVECYKLRFTEGFAWADITIDAKESTGRIQIASDYGSWQYYWGACGVEFKEFLIRLNKSYTAGKMGESKWFDLDKTIEALQSRIADYTTNKQEIKELREELKILKDSSCKEEFCTKMWSSDKIMEMEGHCPDMTYSVSPSFNNFWDEIWVHFVNELKKEIEV